MNATDWSWVLFAVGCFGLWLSGYNPKLGWWFSIANQILAWLPYSIATQQWGMAAMSLVFTGLYSRNLWRWRHSEMHLSETSHSGARQTQREGSLT